MRRNIEKTALIGMAAMMMAGCASSTKTNEKDAVISRNQDMRQTDPGFLIMSDSQKDAIERCNEFAISLFNTQVGMDSKVVSPISVAYLMGMLANGAQGDTQEAIIKTLKMNGVTVDEMNEAFKALLNTLAQNDGQTKIKMANCIAVNKNVSLKKDFRDKVENIFNAEVESLDFASPATVDRINKWCGKQTEGMIPKIINQLDANAVSVLMNAIYFNGNWKKKFDKGDTKEERFQGYTRDIKRVQMMHQRNDFKYMSDNNLAAVELPYNDGNFSMTVILPNSGTSISDIMKGLNANELNKLKGSMRMCDVDLKLPKFSTTTDTNLNKPIASLGAERIFSGSADFGAMADKRMNVTEMLQKARIEVSETGTKAAAVTAAIMTMSALGPDEPRYVEFHADRPFVYVITDRTTGAILFMGQYLGD